MNASWMQSAGKTIAWTLCAICLLTFLTFAWVGIRGAVAYRHLDNIQTTAANSLESLADDPGSAAPEIARLASQAADAHELTSDPIWAVAELVPWVGPQLRAFSTVTESIDQVFSQSLLPLASAANGISVASFAPVAGRVNVTPLESISQPAREASLHAAEAAQAVQRISPTPLIGLVGSSVRRVEQILDTSASQLDALSRASQLLPLMLNGETTRQYLVLVQNNAEWRSLGGISGTAVLLRVTEGRIELVSTESATSLSQHLRGPIIQLPDDVRDIYDTRPARYFHNLTQIPDFSIDGPMAQKMFLSATGIAVDGVIAIDPVALSYLLQSTGPVSLPDGSSITATNAPDILMNQVYLRYADPQDQDRYFAGATSAVFGALLEGRGSAAGMVSALSRAAREHRLLLWSSNPSEQQLLEGTTIADPLPSDDAQTARWGVFLNDSTGSKMSYYIRPDVILRSPRCAAGRSDEAGHLTLQLTLTSNAPVDAATTLPEYITGGGAYGVAPGNTKIVANIFLPQGYELVSAQASNGAGFAKGRMEDREVLTFGAELSPQASVSATVVVTSRSPARNVEAYVTPTADPTLSPVILATCAESSTSSETLQ